MQKSSLIGMLQTFTKDDMARFGDFVESPFFNKKSNVTKLYYALRKYAPEFPADKITKEEMWKKVFPGKLYNYGIMKNLIHELAKLAEGYFGHSNLENGLGFERHLIKELYSRNKYDLFLSKVEKFKARNAPGKVDSDELFYNKLFVDIMKFEYSENRSAVVKDHKQMLDNMVQYFMHNIFRFANSIFLEEYRVNIKHEYPFIQLFLEYIQKNPELFKGSEYVQIEYYILLCFVENSDEKVFAKLQEVFNRAKNSFTPRDKVAAYIFVENAHELLFRRGVKKYEKDFIKHLIEMVEKDLYLGTENIYPNLQMFTNIIHVCARNGDSKSLRRFITGNIHKLQEHKRVSMLNYALARAAYIEKNYEQVIKHEVKVNHNDFFDLTRDNHIYKLNSKINKAICHYELDNIETVLTEIDTAIHFINNNKIINQPIAQPSKNFFKALKKLTLIKHDYDEITLAKLKEEIDNYPEGGLSKKGWLSEKISEIESLRSR